MNQQKLTNLKMEIIREVEIFYYSSLSQIFINTCIIDLCECQFFPANIKIKKTQLNEPIHHELGQLPILLVNKANIIARQNIWELIISIMNIQLNKRYEFLSVIKLCEQLAIAATLCSEIDLNPYFLLISPWKKYKMHRHNQKLKAFFHQNTQYLNKNDSTLNKEYFLYKLNILARLLKTYEASTKEELFNCYQIFSFALLKHLKMLDQILLQTALANQTLKKNYEKMKENMLIKPQIQRPLRPVSFTNIQLPYLNISEQPKHQNEQKYDPTRPYEKTLQRLFKPIFVTTVLGLGYLAIR